MPEGLVYSLVAIAERFLVEQDQVLSAIRLVDVFFVDPAPPGIPAETLAVMINLLVITKFSRGVKSEHTIQVKLLRPSGAQKPIGESRAVQIDSGEKYPTAPSGFNGVFQIPVLTTEMGTHYLIVEVDDEEIARAPFTFVARVSEPSTN